MSGGKSLSSFAYCLFHFRGRPDLRLAFDAAEKREKEESISLQKDSDKLSKI